jgi:plastocyanin
MNKSAIGGLVILVIILAGGGLLLANHKPDSGESNNATTTSSSDSSTTEQAPANAVATTSVKIKDMAFSPADITVKVGDTVTWTNNDSMAHTITETDGQTGPKSSTIDPGKSFVFTYDHAGTYKYDCSIHPSMTGSVTVTER